MNNSFSTTRWTLVLDAADTAGGDNRPALEVLCRQYWAPLYSFARQKGQSHEDAQDSTQAFFAHLLESNLPARATPELGRFRSFLLKAFQNFLSIQYRDATRVKRGGTDAMHLSMDEYPSLHEEVLSGDSPERSYERKWAHTLLNLALEQLAEQQRELNNQERFTAMRPLLLNAQKGDAAEKDLARQLGMSETNIRASLSRLRGDFRDLVRAEVARIVDDPADIDDEIAYLLRALKE